MARREERRVPKIISGYKRFAIARALAEKKSQRAVARELRVSRNFVAKIAALLNEPTDHRTDPFLLPFERRVVKPVRCPECRGLIEVLPCRACRLSRQVRADDRARRRFGEPRGG